ncbi:MAG TPA: peptidase M50 [Brevundimonas sp.]|uniref:metalloprotease n=1 Tax=Brevundimonas sp. TaxID=1871086 RepID=UPI00260876D1|nr:peptidase M50 [Brevundimonas sp.]HRO34266.1 peptidase M50 [Brevundimonas sp.]
MSRSEDNPAPLAGSRRPGPWDRLPEAAAPAPAPAREPEIVHRGQNPVWAVVSTLLLGGFLWWITGTWVAAVAGVFGLFVHEYGHVLAMNRLGMGPAHIHIIPFLGGMAQGQRAPRSEWHGVLVSLAGPAFGLLAMIPFVGAWVITGGGAWLFGAFFIAMINLLNLVPAPPLDGSKALGPVLARVHPMLEKAALIAVGVLVVWWGLTTGRFILAAFLAIAVIGHLRRGAWRPDEGPLSIGQAMQSLGLYLATGAVCAAAAVGALIPLGDGTVMGALELGARFVGMDFGGVAGPAA